MIDLKDLYNFVDSHLNCLGRECDECYSEYNCDTCPNETEEAIKAAEKLCDLLKVEIEKLTFNNSRISEEAFMKLLKEE